jgi:hypothetical protein
MTYIGSRIWKRNNDENCKKPVKNVEVASSAQTVMFADCAMAKADRGALIIWSIHLPNRRLTNGAMPGLQYISGTEPGRMLAGWTDIQVQKQ